MSDGKDDIVHALRNPEVINLAQRRRRGSRGGDGGNDMDLNLSRYPLNDLGNGQRLVKRHGHDLIYVDDQGWFFFNGMYWSRKDGNSEAQKAAHATVRALGGEISVVEKEGRRPREDDKAFFQKMKAYHAWANTSGNGSHLTAMVEAAKPYLRVGVEALDARPQLLVVPNGTLVLDDDVTLKPHDRDDLITRCSPVTYTPEAECPQFRQFLNRILPDVEIQTFLQRWMGYALTGHTVEQRLVLLHGAGANGKSTLMELLIHILGSYARTINFASLLQDDRRRGSEASPDLARLIGARLVHATEPDAGRRLSESTIKALTGGDIIVTRHLHKDFFEFHPQFKICLSFNKKPSIRGQDEGIWRRILVVPFTETIPPAERDKRLKERLIAEEAPGILNWALDGYRLYHEQGLTPPPAVEGATQDYRRESDPISQFLQDCTIRDGGHIQSARLYLTYEAWCRANAIDPVTHNRFSRLMTEQGYKTEKYGVSYYANLSLISPLPFEQNDEADDI